MPGPRRTERSVRPVRWIVLDLRGEPALLHELAVDPLSPDRPRLPLEVAATDEVAAGELGAAIAEREADRPRWVVDDVARRYPALLAAGVRLSRCHDLRLSHTIVRRSLACAGSALAVAPPGPWDRAAPGEPGTGAATLFDALDEAAAAEPDPLTELAAQLEAVGSAGHARLRLLLAAESTGALIAAEIAHDGLPWDAAEHDRVLTALLGPRPAPGRRPVRLEELAARIRDLLDAPGLNPDSPPDLLHALRRGGLEVTTTRRHEIAAHRHPVVEPLLAYKRLARLASANGWAWLDTWVRDGRFAPDYVVGGVVTGRWSTAGGGALQLPAQIRSAVRADPGWVLVVADAAQLEPRVLAGMSGDAAMASAARGADLYQALADAGVVATRAEAKVGMLGAIYGGTTGASAAVLPRLAAAFPRAFALVEDAARAGERGEQVSTWLGRSSPRPGPGWWVARAAGGAEGADRAETAEARRRARDWGRFTRNFVVQGTAAEWALCWMAALRRRLTELAEVDGRRAHLVFFLHDEVIVHAPAALAGAVAEQVRAAAAEAGQLLFGGAVELPVEVAVVRSYDQAAH